MHAAGDVSQSEPVDFLYCLLIVVGCVSLLAMATFMDAFAPVMQAKAKAATLAGREVGQRALKAKFN